MQLAAIRSKYPMGDRFSLFVNCCKRAQTPAEYIREIKPMFTFKEEFKQDFQQDLAMKICVNETGYL